MHVLQEKGYVYMWVRGPVECRSPGAGDTSDNSEPPEVGSEYRTGALNHQARSVNYLALQPFLNHCAVTSSKEGMWQYPDKTIWKKDNSVARVEM